MTAAVLASIALALMAVWAITTSHPSGAPSSTRKPVSPLDEAERILTARYARGIISTQEYERMLVILRR